MTHARYLPVLELRPAEMLALSELPNKDKDSFVPLFRLRPWSSSHSLDKSIGRLQKAYGDRRAFLEVAEAEYVDPDKRRAVHGELDALRDPSRGYHNWIEYLKDPAHQHFIPCLQFGGTPADFLMQVRSLYALGRGILARLERPSSMAVDAVARVVGENSDQGRRVTFVLDYGKQREGFAKEEQSVSALIRIVERSCPDAEVAISASSFPDGFVGITEQNIFERVLYDRLRSRFPNLIFSDRGSARAEKQLGGGGLPAPRVDYAKKTSWHFYRQYLPVSTAFKGYQEQALAVISDARVWDKRLKLWACQMIEKTAAGDSEGGISSPNRSTAVRINLHLHRQANFYDEAAFLDTDEDWID